MFVTIKERLRQLENMRNLVENGDISFNPDLLNFGFRRMDQLLDVSENAIKGYPCVAYNKLSDSVKFGIKIIPLENRYSKKTHPCHLEARVLREATELVRNNESPHIAYYFTSFAVRNKNRAVIRFPIKALQDEVYKESDVLVAEYVPGGCVDEWVNEQPNITEKQWKYVIFSVAWTLHVLQDKLRLHHNDFHCGNVLIDTSIDPCDKSYYQYVLEKLDGESLVFNVQSCGVLTKLWDPEFSASYDKDRTFKNDFYDDTEEDIPHSFNPHYDLHCFLMSLLSLPIPTRLMNYIYSIYPKEVIPPESELSLGSRSSNSNSNSNADDYYDYYDEESSGDPLSRDDGGVASQEGYDSYANSDADDRQQYQTQKVNSLAADRSSASRYTSQRRDSQQDWDELQRSLYYEKHYRTDESSSGGEDITREDDEENDEDNSQDIPDCQEEEHDGWSTNSSQTSRIRTEYTLGDRLLNGAEKVFKLPTPFDIITSDYFAEYRKPIPEGPRKDGSKRVPSCVFSYKQRDHSDEEEIGLSENETIGNEVKAPVGDEDTQDTQDTQDNDGSEDVAAAESESDDISLDMKLETLPLSDVSLADSRKPHQSEKRKPRRPPTPIPSPRRKRARDSPQ